MSAADQRQGLWELAHERGMSRRRFLWLLSAGGATAVLAACTGTRVPAETLAPTAPAAEMLPWFKDPDPFIVRGTSGLEARLENLDGLITPERFFFVRNNSVSLDVAVDDWSLSITGDAVPAAVEMSYDDVLAMESRTLEAYLECAGNHRAMFDLVNGQAAEGTQWGTGAVGNATWTGVPLADVLRAAGISYDAVSVMLIGMDVDSPEMGFRRVIPAAKAMDPDTLLVHGMNGSALPRDHGYPLRALIPGWVGSTSIKWLSQIVVSADQQWARNNTTSYVLIGDAYPPEGEALGEVATAQTIKSALALPWPAELDAGVHRIGGYAHSPAGRVAAVEWSDDSGRSWREAQLVGRQARLGWARFEFRWDAPAGEHTVMTRATDTAGNAQPEQVPFNKKGYLFNQPVPHPVRVV
ncbi:sulfite oxidase [Candidatus Poriferisodalis multihospitum]|uniref:sulfite oxidase n=1 Tax=Candidatus Poriferisodalis multihospitum TaxID=2983191 RepID=UPI002B25EC46|nr:sulfite oxidase [Candidatus Poriferisodalis multihospitum]